MNILGIETSCDETALAIVNCDGGLANSEYKILADAVHSQIAMHQQFGGVVPTVAKREHGRNLIPLFRKIVECGFESPKSQPARTGRPGRFPNSNQARNNKLKNISTILEREPELLKLFLEYIPVIEKPAIDVIAVTQGPGLEPALWVGINFAKALGMYWDIPVIPINHMEGHIVSVLVRSTGAANEHETNAEICRNKTESGFGTIKFPALALLISGGHTELVLVKNWCDYQIIGETRDDAVGEAFDKVARIVGLPYPGGPYISALAEKARADGLKAESFSLPRPMLNSNDCDFSFSGLKTAVLYLVKKETGNNTTSVQNLSRSFTVSPHLQKVIAREFEDAVTHVLVHKTKRALLTCGAKTLIIAGGVSANRHIRRTFERETELLHIPLVIPDKELSTDNAVMIAVAGYIHFVQDSPSTKKYHELDISAHGTLKLEHKLT